MNPLEDLIVFCTEHGGFLKDHKQFGELALRAIQERKEHLVIIDLFVVANEAIEKAEEEAKREIHDI